MLKKTFAALGTALMLSSMATGGHAADLIINHGWTSPAEVAALNVFRRELEAKGHTWTDFAIPHNQGVSVSLINLITGGNPPNVWINSNPDVYREIFAAGYGGDLTDFYAKGDYKAHLPAVAAKSITVDGMDVMIPIAIHVDGMLYYNLDVAAKAGVDPKAWKSLDEMFADFPKIRAAGFEPLAIGGQEWQIGYLFHALAAATGGPDFYNKVWTGAPDQAAFDSPEMRTALETLRKFQQETDAGSPNRDWNVTTNMVITGKALMQIHGDWMKGEWTAAGKTAGVDFGCTNIPGTKAISVTVDNFGVLGGAGVDAEKWQAELDFASIILDPKVQAEFSKLKGSNPTRTDVPRDTLDICSLTVLDALGDTSKQVANTHIVATDDWRTSIDTVVFSFWSDPTQSVDTAIEGIKAAYDAIYG
ncbi:MAG TPA: ABC transporter substrate-binding protein [Devosia sp.]|nr:ABC transporter substrate-binding protein [Devosia sp.]